MSYRRYCFTVNNYTDEEYRNLIARFGAAGAPGGAGIRYLVVGKEVGASGTPHLQGYVEFEKRVRLSSAKKLLGVSRGHLERALGTGRQASEYCKKDDDYVEFGTLLPGQGHRSDLLRVYEIAESTHDPLAVLRECPGSFIKYWRGIEHVMELTSPPRDFRTQVVYVWGRPGSGKSRFVQEESLRLCNGRVAWLSDNSLRWFDGFFSGAKGVVLDDFAGEPRIEFLLRLFDRYPLRVPIKGGFLNWAPRIVWVTSNYPIEHWYGDQDQHFIALMRRIDDIRYME